ncbi:MAG: histidine phosphatase family protein, partial [Sphingomonadaceae bacterium]
MVPSLARAADRSQFFLVRHGESCVNTSHDPGIRDEGVSYPLTAQGIAQAKAMAGALPAAPGAIWASTR